MKNIFRQLSVALLCGGLLLGGAACSTAQTRVVQGIYALAEAVNINQTVALSILQSNTLSADQRSALKALEHSVGEETQALLTKVAAVQRGENVSVTTQDLKNAQKDLGVLKTFIAALKTTTSHKTPEQTAPAATATTATTPAASQK